MPELTPSIYIISSGLIHERRYVDMNEKVLYAQQRPIKGGAGHVSREIKYSKNGSRTIRMEDLLSREPVKLANPVSMTNFFLDILLGYSQS